MVKIATSDFQKGMFINFKGEICQITEFQHVAPGKGSAFIRTKLKNVKAGNMIDFTFKSGESVEQVPVNVVEMQYLFKDGDNCIFMNKKSFEQLALKKKYIDRFVDYLNEGNIYQILVSDNQALGMRYPKKVKLKVVEADEATRGNTVTGAKKMVMVETGIKITVPLFIKNGDTIAIDPQTGEYLERVSQ